MSVNVTLLKDFHIKLNRGRGEILETEIISKGCVYSNVVDIMSCKLMVIIQKREM